MDELKNWTANATKESLQYKVTLEFKGVSANALRNTVEIAKEKAAENLLNELKAIQKRGYHSFDVFDDEQWYCRHTFLDGSRVSILFKFNNSLIKPIVFCSQKKF